MERRSEYHGPVSGSRRIGGGPTGAKSSARLTAALRSVCLASTVVLWGLAFAVISFPLGPYWTTTQILRFLVLPGCVGIALLVLLTDARLPFEPRDSVWASLCVFLAAGGGSLALSRVNWRHPSALLLSLAPLLVATAVAFRRRQHPGLALSYVVFTCSAIALFAFELPVYRYWADEHTFQFFFPRTAPFTGPGGRLRPDVECRIATLPYHEGRGVRFKTNNFGFRNDESFATQPDDNEQRVLSLGDSFSVGYGIDQSEFFGPRLARELARLGHLARVMNAEVSDPAYGLFFLQKYGLGYEPRVVVYGLCENDILQTFLAIGPDRVFVLDNAGRLIANPERPRRRSSYDAFAHLAYHREAEPATGVTLNPSWKPYKYMHRLRLPGKIRAFLKPEHEGGILIPSYAAAYENRDGRKRLIDGFNNLGFALRPCPGEVESIYQRFFEVLSVFHRQCRSIGARFVLLVYPARHLVVTADWQALVERWNLDPRDFDLNARARRLAEACRERGIPLVDLTEGLRTAADPASLFQPNDAHLSSRGYAIAAREAARAIHRLDALSETEPRSPTP